MGSESVNVHGVRVPRGPGREQDFVPAIPSLCEHYGCRPEPAALVQERLHRFDYTGGIAARHVQPADPS